MTEKTQQVRSVEAGGSVDSLPRLDLVRRQMTHMCMQFYIEEPNIFLDLLRDDTGDASSFAEVIDNQFFSFAKYRRSGVEHMIVESVAPLEDSAELAARVAYDVATEDSPLPSGRVPKALRHEGELFHRLTRLSDAPHCLCHAAFQFPASSEGQSVPTKVGLPIRPSGDADQVFDEIWSVRGLKYGDKEEEKLSYSFSLSRYSDGTVELEIRFATRSPVDAHLPLKVLSRACELANGLVPNARK